MANIIRAVMVMTAKEIEAATRAGRAWKTTSEIEAEMGGIPIETIGADIGITSEIETVIGTGIGIGIETGIEKETGIEAVAAAEAAAVATTAVAVPAHPGVST